jgi:hypothetical protein
MADNDQQVIDQGEVSQGTVDELAEAIGQEGTLAAIQAKVPKIRFDPGTETLQTEKVEGEGEGGEEKTEEEKAAEAAAAEAAKKAAEEAKKGEEVKPPKYKSRKEAEAAALEATRQMTTAKEEAARAKDGQTTAEARAEKAEKEATELKAKLEEVSVKAKDEAAEAEAAKEAEITAKERFTRIQKATKEALADINKLEPPSAGDEEAEDKYRDAVAACWAKAWASSGLTGVTLTQAEVDKMVQKTLSAERKAEKEAAEKEKRERAQEDVDTQAEGLAKGSGLDMTPGSWDHRLFWSFADDLPKQEFMKGEKPPPLKEQVEWVVGQVKKAKDELAANIKAEEAKTKKRQTQLTPMVKEITPRQPGTTPEEETYTLASLQRQINDKARAQHRGA